MSGLRRFSSAINYLLSTISYLCFSSTGAYMEAARARAL